jgi:hypothetical protein
MTLVKEVVGGEAYIQGEKKVETKRKYKTGDLVSLISGSIIMTVESYPQADLPTVRLAYESLDGTIEITHLHEDAIEAFEPDKE